MFVTDCGNKISLADISFVDANEDGLVLMLTNGDEVQIVICDGASDK